MTSHSETKTVDLSAGTVTYQDSGRGPTILFLHGFMVTSAVWRKMIPSLEADFRCVVPDWPFGSHPIPMKADADLSPPGLADLVLEFMERVDLKDVTLVGNDLGCAVCQLVAARHSQRLARLVLTPGDLLEYFPPPIFAYLPVLPHIPFSSQIVAQLLRIDAFRRLPFMYGWLSKRRLDSDLLESYVRPMIQDLDVRRDCQKVMVGVEPRHTMNAIEELAKFQPPVLIAWAIQDQFFPMHLARQLQAVFPRATLVPVEDSYTMMPEDQPERLVKLIRDFCHQG